MCDLCTEKIDNCDDDTDHIISHRSQLRGERLLELRH